MLRIFISYRHPGDTDVADLRSSVEEQGPREVIGIPGCTLKNLERFLSMETWTSLRADTSAPLQTELRLQYLFKSPSFDTESSLRVAGLEAQRNELTCPRSHGGFPRWRQW